MRLTGSVNTLVISSLSFILCCVSKNNINQFLYTNFFWTNVQHELPDVVDEVEPADGHVMPATSAQLSF